MYFIVKLIIIMVILVFFLVISVNRRLFRYFGSYSCISVIPVILVNRRTPNTCWRQTWNMENLEIAHGQSWNSKFDRVISRFLSELAQDYSLVFNIL